MGEDARTEIEPPPPAAVDEAIRAALREPPAGGRPANPWWRAGVEDAVRDDLSRE